METLLYPSATNRLAYEQLPEELKKKVIAKGEEYLHFTYPAIKATDFMQFRREGNRVDFEALYFAKRTALNALVLAECVEYQGRFLDDIINGIFSICEESGWQLSAHNSYYRGEPSYLLPDVTRPVLDLFSCETGALLACLSYLLEEALNQVSPLICKRISTELKHRIEDPYFSWYFWWMGGPEEPTCNWTSWCIQNILLTFFFQRKDQKVLDQVLEKATLSCNYFLRDYGQDGCCDEGAQYYRHAGLCLFNALEVMNAMTDGGFSSFYEQEKVKNIAAYILNVHVAGPYYFNFADCSPLAGRAGVREYLFGKRTNNPDLCRFAALDFSENGFALSNTEINLFYRLQELFTYQEISQAAQKYAQETEAPLPPDIYYESAGLWIARSPSFSLGVKAGDNDDSHNHNDTGSFILYKQDRPVFVDIGVESYTAKTFSSQRYELWTMQSGYHNLPTLLDTEQSAGPTFRATEVVSTFDTTNRFSEISMDLAQAYALPRPVEEPYFYRRTIRLEKEKESLLLQDETNATSVIVNFITYEKPEVTSGEIRIGDLAVATYAGAKPLVVETLAIKDPRLQAAWDHDLYRIRLSLTGTVFEMRIG